jgi:hypothetical protein
MLIGLLTTLGLALAGSAQAATVYIDAGGANGGWGCTTCFGGPGAVDDIGSTVTLVNYNKAGPLQLTLGPGTYEVTNASQSLSDYSAWRFDGGATDWAWNFVIGTDNGDNTADILKVGSLSGVLPDQATWQSSTDRDSYYWDNGAHLISTSIATTAYRTTFTLAATTVLDFFVVDGYLPDNAGGVALNINAIATTPIPAALPLFLTGIAGLGFAARRRVKAAPSA